MKRVIHIFAILSLTILSFSSLALEEAPKEFSDSVSLLKPLHSHSAVLPSQGPHGECPFEDKEETSEKEESEINEEVFEKLLICISKKDLSRSFMNYLVSHPPHLLYDSDFKQAPFRPPIA